jgi:hypothetical protein
MSEPKLYLETKLKELLADREFWRAINFVAGEAMANWRISHAMASVAVLSAIGEPKDLTAVHAAWFAGQAPLARTIMRRRVFDLFRKDARRADHLSLPSTTDGTEAVLGWRDVDVHRNPAEWLEYIRGIRGIHAAVACLARSGGKRREQSRLLQQHFLDEIPYPQLSIELGCSEIALRVRVHKAIKVLRKHIVDCHPDLLVIR